MTSGSQNNASMRFSLIHQKHCQQCPTSKKVSTSPAKWPNLTGVTNLVNGTRQFRENVSFSKGNNSSLRESLWPWLCRKENQRQIWRQLTRSIVKRLTTCLWHRIQSVQGPKLTKTVGLCRYVSQGNNKNFFRMAPSARLKRRPRGACLLQVNRTGPVAKTLTRLRHNRSSCRGEISWTKNWWGFLSRRLQLSRSESRPSRRQVMRRSGSAWIRSLVLSGPKRVSGSSLPVTNTITS